MPGGHKDEIQPPPTPVKNNMPPRPPGNPPPELRPHLGGLTIPSGGFQGNAPSSGSPRERIGASLGGRSPRTSQLSPPGAKKVTLLPPSPRSGGPEGGSSAHPFQASATAPGGTSASSSESFAPVSNRSFNSRRDMKLGPAPSTKNDPLTRLPGRMSLMMTKLQDVARGVDRPHDAASITRPCYQRQVSAMKAKGTEDSMVTQSPSSAPMQVPAASTDSTVSISKKASKQGRGRNRKQQNTSAERLSLQKTYSKSHSVSRRLSGRRTIAKLDFRKMSAISPLRLRVISFISSPMVEGFFMIVVFMNAVIMALESELPDARETFDVMDQVFLALYTFELLLRFIGLHTLAFQGWANQLDITIVVVGWMQIAFSSSGARVVNTLKVLRACRVLRCVRMLACFEGLWIVVESFIYCLKPLLWVCVFMFVLIYTFSIFTVELIGMSSDFAVVPASKYFKSTFTAFVTLFQIMTLDEWRAIVQPLCDHRGWAYILFFTYISISALTLMNLLTAVVVEKSVKRFETDEEWQSRLFERAWLLEIEKIQDLLDFFQPEDGELAEEVVINPEELLQVKSTWSALEKTLNGLGMNDAADVQRLFKLLDADDNGELCLNEVIDGLLQLRVVSEDITRAAIIQTVPGELKFDLLGRFTNQLPETNVRRLSDLEDRLGLVHSGLTLQLDDLKLDDNDDFGGDNTMCDAQEEGNAASSNEAPPSVHIRQSLQEDQTSMEEDSPFEEIIKEMSSFRKEIMGELQKQSSELARQEREMNECWTHLSESMTKRYGTAHFVPPSGSSSRNSYASAGVLDVHTRQDIEAELNRSLGRPGKENRKT